MRSTRNFSRGFASLGTLTSLCLGLSVGLLSSCAVDPSSTDPTATGSDDDSTAPVCSGGRVHCFSHIRTSHDGAVRAYAAPQGFGPADLQAAYKIDPNITTTPIVALVDAYGYTNLESDLAAYRSQFGLPPCTSASGCLKIVNQTGGTTPPPNPPASDDWTVETALDVDMVSAACPKCKIVVVQAEDDQGDGLDLAQATAVSLGAAVISNSWGGAEQANSALAEEQYFNHPGVGLFVSAGDSGYDDANTGPDYPATSAHAIAVGGTNLVKDTSTRGWTEKAWTSGGSGCSLSVPKPAYQTAATGCTYKSTVDIAAVGDPQTGVAVYNSGSGGFIVVGGTSASSPMVAALFAATGHNAIPDGTFIMQNAAQWNDVTSGKNGTCPTGMAILCQAGVGWDGPTGYGTPNGAFLKGNGGSPTGGPMLSFNSPSDGASVGLGFQVVATVDATATSVELQIDGNTIDTLTEAPFQFTTPTTLTTGAHTIELLASDANGGQSTQSITIHITAGGATGGDGSGTTTSGDNSNDVVGGCATTGGASSGMVLLGLAFVIRRRRR